MLKLLRAVNHVRKQAGFDPLPMTVLPLRRRIVRPFQGVIGGDRKQVVPG